MAYQISLFLENFVDDIRRKVNQNLDSAKKKVIEQVIKDTDPYVPYKTGALSSNISSNPSEGKFTYEEEYTSFAFNPIAPSGVPKQYTKTVHTEAQGFPFEKAVQEHDIEWVELFREEVMKDVES